MIAEFNRKSFYFGLPGIALQIAGNILAHSTTQATSIMGAVILLIGTILLLTGFVYYAKAKGRHPAWCLVAFLSFIGLIILACLKDKSEIKI